MIVSHASLHLCWAQEEVRVALGTLSEGSIEVANQDVEIFNRSLGEECLQKEFIGT